MTDKRQTKNLPASIRNRLFALAKSRGEDFQLVLTHYALERVMHRIGQSPYREQFVLKGAMLFSLWSEDAHRATRDLDLLGRGAREIARLEAVFREIMTMEVEADGLEFIDRSLRGARIREDQEYEGVRVQFEVRLASARIPVQVDIGFGDAITPAAEEIVYPSLLNLSPPLLLAYPRETVVAEKFQAMVQLGIANSRMKDFYDLWVMSRQFEFAGTVLAEALRRTFARRATAIPVEAPLALTAEYADDAMKQKQWAGFVNRLRLTARDLTLPEVIQALREFLQPVATALATDATFDRVWRPAGPWQEEEKTDARE
jgi:predicted nucleotidyltransferase component of viral defense system